MGEIELQGIDLITLDPEGRIQNLDVLMRPVNGIVALRDRIAPRMGEYLAARGNAPRGRGCQRCRPRGTAILRSDAKHRGHRA